MVLHWRRCGRAGGCQIKWGCSSVGRAPALQAGGREFESLCLHWIEIKLFRFKRGKQSIPVETPRIAKRFLAVTCEASYMVPWKLNIENNLKYQYRACERSKDLKQRDRKMKGSNIPIIKNKRHPRPLSNINGKQSNLRTTRSAEQRYAKQTRRE